MTQRLLTITKDTPIAARVLAALEDRWDFRTAAGIARQIGVPQEVVEEALDDDRQGPARRSVMRNHLGEPLYALRDRPPTRRERLERLRWVLAR